jgi:hypothetical protein
MEEYLASKELHIINEESDRFIFQTSRGSSDIDLTVTNNNLLAAVSEWEIIPEESLSDHNYLKYKIRIGGASDYNIDNKSQGIRYIIKENKVHEFDRNLVREMKKINTKKGIDGGVEELNRHLSNIILTENDLEQQVHKFAEAKQLACNRKYQTTNTEKKNGTKKSVPCWTESLTIMSKRVNAHRRL